MKEYVLDANAVTRYVGASKGEGRDKVIGLFELGRQGHLKLAMSAINLGEVAYILSNQYGEVKTDSMIKILLHGITIFHADTEAVLEAAHYRHTYHVSYADAFAVALALKRKATLVSADSSFEKFGKSLKWLRLPAYARRK